VRGEQSLIAAVFQNLIANAIKFQTPGVAPRIRITVQPVAETTQFTCADNGIGIDADYGERIFMIFQRLHPKDIYPGTGIGLAMTRKIIEYHGGTIWLAPGDGSGSVFQFALPAQSEKESNVPTR
jgi:light-regulated signal transduction histidine kinase (bacteriophytochrome)